MKTQPTHTPTFYPLPIKCDMSNGRIEFADGELLCTMPPTCVNGAWENKRDLIVQAVNAYQPMLEILKQINEHFDYSDKVYRDALALDSDEMSLHEAIKQAIAKAEGSGGIK